MLDREAIDRQLYWFLTRDPSTKAIILTAIVISLTFACSICYSVTRGTLSSRGVDSSAQLASPTEAKIAQIPPTYTPIKSSVEDTPRMPTAAISQHTSITSLTNDILGGDLIRNSLYVENYNKDLDGSFYPGGQIGYDIDFVVNSPSAMTRDKLLGIAYNLLHEFYFNFSDSGPMFLSLHIRAYQNDVIGGCVLGIGLGHQAAATYLPAQRPSNLEAWFGLLRNAKYYGDLPGQTDAQLAYGNDPGDAANCDMESWRR